MPKTIAELRTSKAVGTPTRAYQLCLAGNLVAEIESLHEQMVEARDRDQKAPKRGGVKSESVALGEKIDALQDEMAEHTGTLTLRGRPQGEWRQWSAEHPAREDNQRDKVLAFEVVDVDALIVDLGRFAAEWNGDPLDPSDWDWLAERAAPGDVDMIAQVVVLMHESSVRAPKSGTAWLAKQDKDND